MIQHASEADRLIHMIRSCKSRQELRAFWSAAQGNEALADVRVIRAKDERKAELLREAAE